ncbi:MAG: phosphoribosylformylglycinamidine synthase [Bacteroidetes bacterium]|jgi:phosphoribosylformylglycinamidine synthase|nr:phosphoribosylformylglycinamidine synthase [Bacteroidota bacterium]
MILFFAVGNNKYYALETVKALSDGEFDKLIWLFNQAKKIEQQSIEGVFVGPRKEMITPWSTNAVEITQNMGLDGITRIESFTLHESARPAFDPMLETIYHNIDQSIFSIDKQPDPIEYITDIATYNTREGLALSGEEVAYLNQLSERLARPLTDSEIFGFSQVNSEHCRHKIFNGKFIIDGREKEKSLFQLIRETTRDNRNYVVSAYKDNCAFIQGPSISQFAPRTQDKPDFFITKGIDSVITLKAETHNFPTTVEPFNGAATGTGGEIRDRLAGGKAAIPLAGTAVYMTSYPRTSNKRAWEKNIPERHWLYQTPEQILIKASNGASDFGNKFGQPLICGSVLTFEHHENGIQWGFDKVIMLAGGIGYGKSQDVEKDLPAKGDKVILLGGDNYRIGMGGGAVSSVNTGEYANAIELNAVQRSNPEMQKRVANTIRAMAEDDENTIISIHDHGAGGHLNCLSELVEESGGIIYLDKLPVGDPTLSFKELIGNESQERMGLVLNEKNIAKLKLIAERERAPFYQIGETTGDHNFTFIDASKEQKPIDLKLIDMFGNPPQTIMEDVELKHEFQDIPYQYETIHEYLGQVLMLENVACKDWLTNKVDRSVTGRVAKQQTAGEFQLPLNNVAVMTLNYQGGKGIATSIGHAPIPGLIKAPAGAILSLAEALTNLVWAPLTHGLKGVSLSANWMWPAKNNGENARLYQAVETLSNFAKELNINIPTGKDSMSMTQKYPDGNQVLSPGTVIISTVAEVLDINKVVEPVLKNVTNTSLYYVSFSDDSFHVGGSSFAQTFNKLGNDVPSVNVTSFVSAFETIQTLIKDDLILSGHDIDGGGLITSLLEMNFPNKNGGLNISLNTFDETDMIKILFSEQPGIIIQTDNEEKVTDRLKKNQVPFYKLGNPINERQIIVSKNGHTQHFDIDYFRDIWYTTSYLLDCKQSGEKHAKMRFENYKYQPLSFSFPQHFEGNLKQYNADPERDQPTGLKAAIIREKGVNGDREMAYAMHLAGFDVKDVHTTDLIAGRENLADVNFVVYVGGFSNSDVLGSAKGWAGAFLYNPKAKKALDNFYKRPDTLSLGVCNGCQLMMELNLVYPAHFDKPRMLHNESHKFESAFLNVTIPENHSIMLGSLAGSRLGIWIAHGEGRFSLPRPREDYHIPMFYTYDQYPGNPNGSQYQTAGLCSEDGRHLAIMPHLERSIFPSNWANYPENRKNDQVSPWIEAFVNARKWVESKLS